MEEKYSIENDKNYHEKVRNYIKQLPKLDYSTVSVDEDEDPFSTMCTLNFPGMVVAVIKTTSGEREIVFNLGPKEDSVCYHPKKIEVATKSLEKDGKDMISFKVDDKFWFYEERIPMCPIYSNFGMDMGYPFLKQQNWRTISNDEELPSIYNL